MVLEFAGKDVEKRAPNQTENKASVKRADIYKAKKRKFKLAKLQNLFQLEEEKNKNWWEDDPVVVAFNLPRISARLERLMGTNVVRLTDRKYMKELRQRLLDDYILTLNKRIEARELKELERERNLILEGKVHLIPDALSNHPIFIVNKRVNNLIEKRRSKMKTNREKMSEKLLRQGAKWERERLIYEELDKQQEDEYRQIKEEQRALEEQYKRDDAINGIQLLRIQDRAYKECEMDLKEFLKKERTRMKARSRMSPLQYTSDPLDIANIVRKRQKFREVERKIRQELDEKFKNAKEQHAKQILARAAATSEMSRQIADQETLQDRASVDGNKSERDSCESGDFDLSLIVLSATKHQLSQTESAYLAKMQALMEEDVVKGFLVSKAQFDELHYSDRRIARLKLTDNIRELYFLAEEIITEEPLVQNLGEEEGQIGEEEEEEEDEEIESRP